MRIVDLIFAHVFDQNFSVDKRLKLHWSKIIHNKPLSQYIKYHLCHEIFSKSVKESSPNREGVSFGLTQKLFY